MKGEDSRILPGTTSTEIPTFEEFKEAILQPENKGNVLDRAARLHSQVPRTARALARVLFSLDPTNITNALDQFLGESKSDADKDRILRAIYDLATRMWALEGRAEPHLPEDKFRFLWLVYTKSETDLHTSVRAEEVQAELGLPQNRVISIAQFLGEHGFIEFENWYLGIKIKHGGIIRAEADLLARDELPSYVSEEELRKIEDRIALRLGLLRQLYVETGGDTLKRVPHEQLARHMHIGHDLLIGQVLGYLDAEGWASFRTLDTVSITEEGVDIARHIQSAAKRNAGNEADSGHGRGRNCLNLAKGGLYVAGVILLLLIISLVLSGRLTLVKCSISLPPSCEFGQPTASPAATTSAATVTPTISPITSTGTLEIGEDFKANCISRSLWTPLEGEEHHFDSRNCWDLADWKFASQDRGLRTFVSTANSTAQRAIYASLSGDSPTIDFELSIETLQGGSRDYPAVMEFGVTPEMVAALYYGQTLPGQHIFISGGSSNSDYFYSIGQTYGDSNRDYIQFPANSLDHHITVVLDVSTVKFYFDGNLVGKANFAAPSVSRYFRIGYELPAYGSVTTFMHDLTVEH
jgi:hypothetical protein